MNIQVKQTHDLWQQLASAPHIQRTKKPRQCGYTMVIDKGMGLQAFQDFLETAAEYVDFIKLGFGTSALYPSHILEKKLELARAFDVHLLPGGTFFELAVAHHEVKGYLHSLRQLGFTAMEISDGTISLPRQKRNDAIKLAKEHGFFLFTEHGKKAAGSSIDLQQFQWNFYEDLDHGADLVIVEGRESGENVGIYDEKGEVDRMVLTEILTLPEQKQIMWETPQKKQQVTLIEQGGSNVNLGNIAPHDLFSLESLRRGLRSDTLLTLLAGNETEL